MNQELSNIHQYFNKAEYINKTAQQIIKDFGFERIEITFSGNPYAAYEELFNQIEPNITKLLQDDYRKFMSILYRIDLSETQINKALRDNTSESVGGVITDLIIKRELQKIVIRNFYSKK